MDPNLLVQGLGVIISGVVSFATILLGTRGLRAKVRAQSKRLESQERRHAAEMQEMKAGREAAVLKLRKEHGDAATAAGVQRDMLNDDLTALAMHTAERDQQFQELNVRVRHYGEEIERITGRPPMDPLGDGSEFSEKLLSKSGIFRFTPDPDTKTGGTILFVEDHPDVRYQISTYQKKQVYDIVPAATVAEAKQRIDVVGDHFNLVLLDLMLMDGGNGHVGGDAVAEYLHERGIRAPILLFTAMDEPEARQYVRLCGAVGYVAKPVVQPRRLLAAILDHIRIR